MKKLLGAAGAIIVLILVGVGLLSFWSNNVKGENGLFGGSAFESKQTLLGASTNLVSVPREISFANSTTTQSDNAFAAGAQTGYLDGGQVITQSFPTGGFERIRVNVVAKGGTATSTLFIRQQSSHDDTTYYDVHASSTLSHTGYGTSTPVILTPAGIVFDPGTATTTGMSFLLDTYGSKYTRLLFLADDLTSDPADGVQAWADVVLIDPIAR